MNEQIIIKKLGGARDNIILVNSPEDIPEILSRNVSVKDGRLVLNCIEGEEVVDFGSFIAWEQSDKTGTGINCWCKANGHETIDVVDGHYYERTKPVKAQQISFGADIPQFMQKAPIEIGADGEVILHTNWGDMVAPVGRRYMYLAYEDGSYALLDLDSESANQYFICDDDGNITEQKLVDWICI